MTAGSAHVARIYTIPSGVAFLPALARAVLEEGFPAFVIMVMIALSYSISTGLAFGFIIFVLFKIMTFKLEDVKPAMWIIFGLSLLHFFVR